LQTLLENINAAVVVLDGQMQVGATNLAARKLFGREIRFHREIRDFLANHRQRHAESAELELNVDGTIRTFRVSIVPLPDSEEEMLIAEDVTEILRSERLEAWGEMARQVAHEIKNPLTTMGLALYNMERDLERLPDDARTRVSRAVHALEREIDSMKDLAESFATLGELPPLAPAVVDVNALVESLVEVSQWPHVAIETRFDPAGPRALADERQLRRVLRNLLKNACEAQPAGGRVAIHTRGGALPGAGECPRAVEIEVEDWGPGMTSDVKERMFEPGFTTKGASGKGVGLAVSRRVIEGHGGGIVVDSTPGKGTRVTVRLPEVEETT